MNPAAERLLGWPAGSLLGCDLDLAVRSRAHLVLGTRNRESGEDDLLRRDGSCLPVSWTVGPVEAEGVVLGALLTFLDRTRVSDLEAERDRLRALDRARAQCLALAAHELQSPLASLATHLGLIEKGAYGRVSPELIAVLPALGARVREMEQMIRWLTDVARLEDSSFDLGLETADLRGLAEQAVAAVEARAWPRRKVAFYAPPAGVTVQADPLRLSTALQNLVDNAVKYSAAGQPVSCRVEVVGGFGLVSVRDRGPGIPAARRDRLFTRFGRLVEEGSPIRGTGLGLYLSREIARAHGGDITYQARSGGGSRFTLRVPLAVKPASSPQAVDPRKLPV